MFEAFLFASNLVVLSRNTDGVAKPYDPSKEIQVYEYHSTKKGAFGYFQGSWWWKLNGGDLEIKTGYDTCGWFGASVFNPNSDRTLRVTIRGGFMECMSSQTYLARIIGTF
ncbi:hypothetical protein O181_008716 [Austropuccinia psidii MF-1]|uniref:Uncharacterized protein n=1 Tax=Austropuccinia psidii MF-1 TaxID=1389203 RepID=A0A9Q3GIS8_9BASI|nr:hypothetical protein [Austropuccinia psidii MF-1]